MTTIAVPVEVLLKWMRDKRIGPFRVWLCVHRHSIPKRVFGCGLNRRRAFLRFGQAVASVLYG